MGLHRGPALALGLLLLGGSASPASAQIVPTSIRYEILHAECDSAGAHQFTLFMNGHELGSLPSGTACDCTGSSVSATFADAATLALFDPSGCNRFGVTVGPQAMPVAEVEVRVTTASGPISFCLFDGYPSNPSPACAHQSFCEGATFVTAVGGMEPDGDGDGVEDGLGIGCDNCMGTANANQADSDADGHGNACDTCPGEGPVDSDGDLVCDGTDNCTIAPNPGQEDANGDGFGDICQCVASPEICDDPDPDPDPCTYGVCSAAQGCVLELEYCDDQNACTDNYCVPELGGCWFEPANGNDFNECTQDYCYPDVGFVYVPLTGPPCDDDDVCTVDDACTNGVCGGASAVPGEVPHLRAADPVTFMWDAVTPGPYTVHDVVRGTAALVPQACVAQGIVALTATDAQSPAAGIAWWYLVRARHLVCGSGTYGSSSDGTPRGALGCP